MKPEDGKISIAVLANLDKELMGWLQAHHRVSYWQDPNQLPDRSFLANTEIIIYRSPFKLDADLLANSPKLRWIIRAGSGIDDVKQLIRGRSIELFSTPEAAQSVAEHAIGLMFAAARQLPENHLSLLNKTWRKAEALGVELRGLDFLIIGFGRIGRCVAAMISGLAGSILINDPSPEKKEKQLAMQTLPKVRILSLDEGLAQAEVIFLCCPPLAQERALLTADRLTQIKSGAILVNVGRGSLIDEPALIKRLNASTIRAGLDTFKNEPCPSEALLKSPNLVVSPHVGAQTTAARHRIANKVRTLIENYEQEAFA